MSELITGELRRKMDTLGWYDKDGSIVYTTGGGPVSEMECLVINSKTFGELCDAIDAVHKGLERENDRLKCELDRVTGEMEEHHAWAPESHYMMLPKDADGEPIHVGDVMEWPYGNGEFRVNGIGGNTLFYIDKDSGECEWTAAGDKRHHHAPTVEDVLREFYTLAVRGKAANANDVDNAVLAEYAAKLRLAERSE